MKYFAALAVLFTLSLPGGASAASPFTIGSGVEIPPEPLLQPVQYGRRGPRCFTEVRRVRFIDRFGRPRVRLVERRVCRR